MVPKYQGVHHQDTIVLELFQKGTALVQFLQEAEVVMAVIRQVRRVLLQSHQHQLQLQPRKFGSAHFAHTKTHQQVLSAKFAQVIDVR